MPVAELDPVTRYLEVGLRLGRHLDGLVDAYFGPEDLKARVEGEPQRALPALVGDVRALVADLDAGDGDLDPTRRRWLRAQAAGLHTAARKLAGEDVAFLDEVEQCYGVRPSAVPHDVLAEAHHRLDGALPGSGPLAERYDAWRTSHVMSREQLTAAVHTVAEAFRERTEAAFGLPEGEHIEFELVSDEPWSGFNYYEGGLRSRVAINTDLPVSSTAIGHLIAHEAYPGHHTEHCRKEVGLVRRRQQLEEAIFLVGTPQCLLAEGLADLAIEALLGPDHEPAMAEILHPLGIRYDTEVVAAVSAAGEALSAVRGNAALLLHDQGRSEDDAVAELERWGLLSHERAVKSIAFLTHPTWRSYIFCYVDGLPLCRSFVGGRPGPLRAAAHRAVRARRPRPRLRSAFLT
ncbi:hypothetical protein KSP35_23230 [Aquihabitans sp. G128]|uniref:hypothetical protein n=1 Tax=Aquihabitans sp. G128 TaxID=2849779 RepID=UPI001C245AB6|nr:hypothetical protein [Aquihabitans sp. G128]QXC61187.1 hypothetical protein KSP35_23230 [Aquihabitans sp. G128]